MTIPRAVAGVLVAGSLVAGGWLAWQASKPVPKEPGPRQAIERMTFPRGVGQMTGDEHGRQCVQVEVRIPGHEPFRLQRQDISDIDFRTASEGEKIGALKKAAQNSLEAAGMGESACLDLSPWFLASPAYAQPTCGIDECGGGCQSWGCPADLVVPFPNCFYNGPDCTIIVICCGGCVIGCP